MINFQATIDLFLDQVTAGAVQIYNEFSLQHELGLALRAALGGRCLVQFERPTHFFGVTDRLTKREIDIVVFTPDQTECHAIELKYPRNGQYPEQMFQFCKDVAFLEELVRHGAMASGTWIVIAEDPLFYGRGSSDGIYASFRGGAPLTGLIEKPTGKRDAAVNIEGRYGIEWRTLRGPMKCARVVVGG